MIGSHNQYDWSCGGDKIVHIHQALVRPMAVNMFPFCDKSRYRTIYAAVGREPNCAAPVRQRSLVSAYVKIKMQLYLALSDAKQKFIVCSIYERLNCHCRRCEQFVPAAFNRVVLGYVNTARAFRKKV